MPDNRLVLRPGQTHVIYATITGVSYKEKKFKKRLLKIFFFLNKRVDKLFGSESQI
jgi:hypothetical protein